MPFTEAPGYSMTIPYHPLLKLHIWPLFGWWYLRSPSLKVPRKQEALRLGLYWTVNSIRVDLVGWVFIMHPWVIPFKEFYVDYQPWITLVDLIIFQVRYLLLDG